ncbi:MAG TPA: class I SAM-dependent methyltransferase [Pyrinomonadaceae bacterium]
MVQLSPLVSFRDPSGQLVVTDDRVLRIVSDQYRDATTRFLESSLSAELIRNRILVATKQISNGSVPVELDKLLSATESPLLLEHEPVSFVSYPYEWSPEMLYAAGVLTLDLMERLLPAQFGLKDASPYNVLFRGPEPLFIDFLSIEERDPLDPTWLPYAQFVRNFIRPLLANKYFGLGLDQVFRVYRDGLQPDQVFRLCSLRQKFHPHFVSSVSLPSLLSRVNPSRYDKIYEPRKARSKEQAHFILHRQIKGLRRKLEATKPDPNRDSQWSGYDDAQEEHYTAAKTAFVETALKECRPARVLDVGCNRGTYSLLAAGLGSSVVAIDQDEVVIGGLWRAAKKRSLNILPLVIDITRPTAGLGWRNRETRGFLERAIGSFDCVLMQAVIHHMLVTERIPLTEILQLASELTTDRLVIEWIDPKDDMFHLLTRGNSHLYEYLTRELFERLGRAHFSIERAEELPGSTRWLYEMRRQKQVA